MFKKFRLQMTFFCSLITSAIMVAMSIFSVASYEVSQRNNEYASFLNDIHSMIANLESQSVISYEWLTKMEKNGQYILSLSNNGHKLMYDEIKEYPQRDELVKSAADAAYTQYGIDLYAGEYSNVLTEHNEFTLSHQSKEYFVSAAVIPKGDRFLGVLMIHSLESMRSQMIRQRIIFLIFNLVGVTLLFIFSFFFIRRMIRPIQKSREQQTQFVSLASHELRTPLAVILSSLSAMDKGDAQDSRRFKKAIETEGQRMSRLIDDLLLLASADNTSFSVELAPLELDTLLIETYEKFELIANKKGISLFLELPEESFPPCTGDRTRLEQVFSILLDNAVSYTPESGSIHITLEQLKSVLEVRVTDSGPGIPDALKEQIWERFYRVEKSRTERRHFGLGLSIAREIVSAHRGRIWVEDGPAGGSVFIVQLPFQN